MSLDDLTTQSGRLSAKDADPLSSVPLLDVFENFQGSFLDLERNLRVSAGTLKRLRTDVRERMQDLGLSPGDRLITAAPNGALFAAVWAASLEAGASPILVHADTPAAELCRMAESWGALFIVGGNWEEHSTQPVEFVSSTEHGVLRWQRVESPNCEFPVLPSVPLHPTSGTSGGPKVAVRPGPCAVAEPLHYIESLSIDHSDVILCALPMSHAYAYGICFLAALLTSADLLYLPHFNPALLTHAVNQMKVSLFPAVPIMLDAMLTAGEPKLVGRPRIVLSAGAPLKKETFEACRDRWGPCVRSLYGTTETGGISIAAPDEEFDNSVGRPMRGVEVEVGSLDNSGFSPDTGVLRVRSSSMMRGYLESKRINNEMLANGWFETADLANIDKKGAIHLHGRLSEVINVLGFKVMPKEVEDVIAMLPQVREVKVYPGSWRGQTTVEAAVVRSGNLKEETILRHCDRYLVSYKCPSTIRFLESLPRTPAGKVAVERL